MKENFVFIPDLRVFELTSLAKNQGIETPCLKFFKKAWIYKVDTRRRVIIIPKELNDELIKKGYRSEAEKTQSLYSILRVYDETFADDTLTAVLRLASKLSIDTDEDIYVVTEDEALIDVISKRDKLTFKVIKPEEAIKMMDNFFDKLTKENSKD